nr:MAG TPA: hypothetical protein [Caudoviricetes sp.]
MRSSLVSFLLILSSSMRRTQVAMTIAAHMSL